jgi:hypothetical protein
VLPYFIGAGGGTRTRTTFYGPGILSPVRLPFRHTGNTCNQPTPRKPRPNPYRKVLDSRKRCVRGVWQRNGRIYANLTVADDLGRKTSRWVLLAGATLDEAKADYARLVTERADDGLRPLGLGKQ